MPWQRQHKYNNPDKEHVGSYNTISEGGNDTLGVGVAGNDAALMVSRGAGGQRRQQIRLMVALTPFVAGAAVFYIVFRYSGVSTNRYYIITMATVTHSAPDATTKSYVFGQTR